MRKLKKLLKTKWGIKLTTLDKSIPLMHLAEYIVCKTENIKPEEAYEMWVGTPMMNIVVITAIEIATEMGNNVENFNIHSTVEDIL